MRLETTTPRLTPKMLPTMDKKKLRRLLVLYLSRAPMMPAGTPNPDIEEVVSDRVLEVPRPEVTNGAISAGLTPYQVPLIARGSII